MTRLYRLWIMAQLVHPRADKTVLYEVAMLAYASTLPMMHDHIHGLVAKLMTIQEHVAHRRMVNILAMATADQHCPLGEDLATDDEWVAWMDGL